MWVWIYTEMHAGYDIGRRRGQANQRNPDCSQKHFAHALADAGATIVLGSHPTIVQGYEKYRASDLRDVLIAYSLGDFTSSNTMNLTAIIDNGNNSSTTLHASALFNDTTHFPHAASSSSSSTSHAASSNHSSTNHSSATTPTAAPAPDTAEELETLKRYAVLLNVQLTWDHKRQFAHVSCFSFLPLTRLSRVTGHHSAESPDQSTSTNIVTEYSVITVRVRVHVYVCVRACACVHVCVRACVCVCACALKRKSRSRARRALSKTDVTILRPLLPHER